MNNNTKHIIHTLYNETILNNKGKEVLLNNNLIEYWRKKILILNVNYDWWSFETKVKQTGYTLISISSNEIKDFFKSFINNYKWHKWDKIYCLYHNELYFLEYQKTKEWHLYNLSTTWYWYYDYI